MGCGVCVSVCKLRVSATCLWWYVFGVVSGVFVLSVCVFMFCLVVLSLSCAEWCWCSWCVSVVACHNIVVCCDKTP